MSVFEQGSELQVFFRGQQRIAAWLAKNHKPVSKATLSRALGGHDADSDLVDALDRLFDDVSRDPWSFCKPPPVEQMTEYATCRWWYDALEPAVVWSRFERINQFPLTGNDLEVVQAAYDDWHARLEAACARYQEDYDLVRSLHSDLNPKYQSWSKDPWRLDAHGSIKRRIGFPGLAGRSPEEIGRAFALDQHELPLPNTQKARLEYERPYSVPVDDYEAEPVGPWNGDEFEGIEEVKVDIDGRSKRARHRVCFYWDGQRYLVEDVEPFAMIEDGEWRAPTQDERDFLETGMVRETKTRDEFVAGKEAWIDQVWEERKAERGYQDQIDYPDGIPRSAIEEHFAVMLERYEDGGYMAEKAREERREYSRRRLVFMRGLRRRPLKTDQR
ncbi:MAG: hypothetical protein CSA68_11615 [Rhodobacterales bacterium]|nr:MAG: hypothetical protein CSA68_11615 [Rhodobacterales bacterium]